MKERPDLSRAGFASGSQDADLGSTGWCFNLQKEKKLLYLAEDPVLASIFYSSRGSMPTSLHRNNCAHLLCRPHWIASGGRQIFLYDSSNQSYHLAAA